MATVPNQMQKWSKYIMTQILYNQTIYGTFYDAGTEYTRISDITFMLG